MSTGTLIADIDTAKYLLRTEECTCALVKDGEAVFGRERGIAPILDFIASDKDFSGYSAADKTVGKVAALLYVYMGVKEVYADIMSRHAVKVFEKHGIKYRFDTEVEYIINRKKDGPCPMETAVLDIDEPSEAVAVLKSALKKAGAVE